ncbi:MAG TPA: ribokinase [Candidatus Binatia bacterium]|nr:ribokinase [Candidatus Binatia bacterium]
MPRQGEINESGGGARAPRRAAHDVIVIGGVNTDYLIRGGRLPKPGETVNGKEFMIAGGGKGANQAVAAARLGARVAFIACLGQDARGDELEKLLRAERLETRLFRDGTTPSGAALIMVDDCGEKQIDCAPGANHKLTPAHIRSAASLIRNARVLLMQFEVPKPTVLAAAKIADAAGVRIVLDPAPPVKAPNSLLRLVDVIRPNASEAKQLTGIEVTNVKSARRAAQEFFAYGLKAVAIQAGDAGDLIVWRHGERLLPRMKVKTVDATGAGDAFAAGFSVALAEGRSYAEAAVFANAAAALATTKMGAMPAMPRRREVQRLLSSADVSH